MKLIRFPERYQVIYECMNTFYSANENLSPEENAHYTLYAIMVKL